MFSYATKQRMKLEIRGFLRKFFPHGDCSTCGFPILKKETWCINCGESNLLEC